MPPSGENGEPVQALSAYPMVLMRVDEPDRADIPYVVMGIIDGEQRVRLRGEAGSSCSSIRVGDYRLRGADQIEHGLNDVVDVEWLHNRACIAIAFDVGPRPVE